MSPIHNHQIDRVQAWLGSDLTREQISWHLTQRHVDALEELLRRLQDKPITEITFDDCRHPALDDDFDAILEEVQKGRGMVLVRGFPVSGHTIEEVEKLNWIAGTHLGTAVSQNSLGERIRRIQNEPRPNGLQSASGTKSRDELAMHTDNAEIFTLLCVRDAKSGGNTSFTSALAIHNELLRSRPDVLEILYRGFPWHRRGEQADHLPAITPYNVPVLSNRDGHVSVQIAFGSIHGAKLATGGELTPQEREALDLFRDLTERFQYEMRFEPGDLCVANNLVLVHGRSEYQDWPEPERKRVLVRLHLAARRDRRPVVPELWYMASVTGGPGVDPVPGRQVAGNEYYGVSEEMNKLIKQAQARPKSATA